MRNSNLFPVKAMGEVRFLSVLSCRMFGRTARPMSRVRFPLSTWPVPSIRERTTWVSSSPRKMEITAGGAS